MHVHKLSTDDTGHLVAWFRTAGPDGLAVCTLGTTPPPAALRRLLREQLGLEVIVWAWRPGVRALVAELRRCCAICDADSGTVEAATARGGLWVCDACAAEYDLIQAAYAEEEAHDLTRVRDDA